MQINLNHIERNINRNKTRSEINMQKVINSHCHIYPNKIAARAVEAETGTAMDDELKNMVISQLEKANPAQAESIKGQIDAVIANLKLEVTDNSTFTFAPDGWVDTLQSEVSTQGMGAKTVVRSTIRLRK